MENNWDWTFIFLGLYPYLCWCIWCFFWIGLTPNSETIHLLNCTSLSRGTNEDTSLHERMCLYVNHVYEVFLTLIYILQTLRNQEAHHMTEGASKSHPRHELTCFRTWPAAHFYIASITDESAWKRPVVSLKRPVAFYEIAIFLKILQPFVPHIIWLGNSCFTWTLPSPLI